ncbi:universal stress protein [Desulfosarcina sp.]|uniref:universal stress protein n=1 Tax=Desulfosarcina sp. TaxID=2027861 RepID=UPI0029A371DF|nr:universal stress protein [Desulfosarcina sp.]MDX2455581.1 universal stress protein [Desulfosarcina sp.]MDX2493068.1 universal stress protein [Desulfosarcina sp.]
MYKKILFPTCLKPYCDQIFSYALQMAIENDAKLWIYHGLGRMKMNQHQVEEAIKDAEAKVHTAYVGMMKERNFNNYMINVSDGDAISEITKLARNAAADLIVMGTSTDAPIGIGDSTNVGTFGETAKEIILWAPCPVLVIPPSLVPGPA